MDYWCDGVAAAGEGVAGWPGGQVWQVAPGRWAGVVVRWGARGTRGLHSGSPPAYQQGHKSVKHTRWSRSWSKVRKVGGVRSGL